MKCRIQRLAGLAQITARGGSQSVGKALPAGGQCAAGGAGLGGDAHRHAAQPVTVCTVHPQHRRCAGYGCGGVGIGQGVLQGGQPGLERALTRLQARKRRGQRADRGGEQPAGSLGVRPAGCCSVIGALPEGHSQPHTGLVVGVGDDLDQPDLAGAGKVGAAAGTAVAAGLNQPHRTLQRLFAAVFGAGQCLGVGHPAAHRRVGPHGGVGQLRSGQRDAGVHPHIGVADVEADILGPKKPVQRAAQDMLAGMLLHRVQPGRPVQAAGHLGALGQRGIGRVGHGLAVCGYRQHPGTAQRTGVAGLAAALGEKGRAVQHNGKAARGGAALQHPGGKALDIRICFVYFLCHEPEFLSNFWDFSYYNIKQV